MPALTTVIGSVLTLLGLGGYVGSGQASKTALIPSGFGLVLVVLGLLGRNPQLRPHVMHAAAGVGLLGVIGSARGVPQAVKLLQGQEVARPAAAVAQATMAGLCATYVGFSLRSFIAARRARRGEA